MTEPVFGLTITSDDDEPYVVIAPDLGIVGAVVTAPDADPSVFPLNLPVLMSTADSAMLAALGSSGTGPDAMTAINDQLGDYQAAATAIVVRVEEEANDFLTIQNIIGTEAAETGMYALLMAGELLGAIPRLCMFPGYTHQSLNALGTLVLGSAGSGYTAAPAVTFTGGGNDPNLVLPTAHTMLGSADAGTAGKVASIVIDTFGENITGPLTVAIAPAPQGGTQATAVATIDTAGNAVCAAAPGVLDRLLAHAVVEGPGTTEAAAKAWRATLNSQRLIPIDMWCKIQVGDTIQTRPGAPRVIGIGVRRDYEFGGVPSHSWANQAVQGIVGFVRRVGFSLTDGATEGQRLLLANIGIGVRGELGVESAIASSGFVFIGTDVATDDPLWTFYNETRMRDFINLGLLKTLRYYLGKFNITLQAVQAVLNTMDSFLSGLQASSAILGFKVAFDPSKNTPETIRAGRIRVGYQSEPAPVLRRIDIDGRRYRQALNTLISEIAAAATDLVSTADVADATT